MKPGKNRQGAALDDRITRGTVDRAQAGDYECAYEILDHFVKDVRAGVQPEPAYMEYLANCFSKILEGECTEKVALNLLQPSNRPESPETFARYVDIVEVVERIRLNLYKGKKIKVAHAIKVAAKHFCVSQALVIKARKNPAATQAAINRIGATKKDT